MAALKISNKLARRLWLDTNGLGNVSWGDNLSIIRALGFVQLDTIQVVSRAHHHIFWSRNPKYSEPDLDRLMRQDRVVFEHFTHDASVLPIEFLPMWQRQFARMKAKVEKSNWYGEAFEKGLADHVLRRIADEGPLCTKDFDAKTSGKKQMWQRPPHKKALDYLWYSGVLATSHRDGFTKFYDLAERVFPCDLHKKSMEDQSQVDWLNGAALDRLGFATQSEIKKFWDAVDVKEVRQWVDRRQSELITVEIQSADGRTYPALARSDIETALDALQPPTNRIRILNPFDPAIRDRTRLCRLFGFDYKVEMFVPEAKRIWGYYVFPILEGDRFIGRLEAKGNRKVGVLSVTNLWLENGVILSDARSKRLDAELSRFAKLADLQDVIWGK